MNGHDLIAAFREHHGPSDAAVERIAVRLRTLGPAVASDNIVALPSRPRRGPIVPVAVAVIAVAAALVLGWWIRGETITPTPERTPSMAEDKAAADQQHGTAKSRTDRAHAPGTAPSRDSGSAALDAAPDPPNPAAPGPSSPETADRSNSAPRDPSTRARPLTPNGAGRRPTPQPKSTPTPPEPTTTKSMAEEIRLIQRARAQLLPRPTQGRPLHPFHLSRTLPQRPP